LEQLKGCPEDCLDKEVDDMIRVLRLEDKRDVFSSNLSGGMKRKLSVGIALIAGSKVFAIQTQESGVSMFLFFRSSFSMNRLLEWTQKPDDRRGRFCRAKGKEER
jgi:ABC-type Na+ transport system ATPase subunit NatA